MTTKTTTTVEGEVTYETVTCASCGQEIPKEQAKRFVIGDLTRKWTYSNSSDELKFSRYTEGWACEHCRDHDPVGYPQTDSFWKRMKYAFGAIP